MGGSTLTPRAGQPTRKSSQGEAISITNSVLLQSALQVEGQQPDLASLPRKRRVDVDTDDRETQQKRFRLTRQNLALLDKMTGAKATSRPSDPTETTTSTIKTTSTTKSAFALRAAQNGILHPVESRPPTNIQDIRERYARSRASASPNESDYKAYVNRVCVASNEATMGAQVNRRVMKSFDGEDGYVESFNHAFSGFPRGVGFNNGRSAPRPDYVEGLTMRRYRPARVDAIDGAVLYREDPFSITLPHLAGEWKGRGKDMEQAGLRSGSDPPGHSAVTTFTTDGTTLNLYAHHAAENEAGEVEYHQYNYATALLNKSYQGHVDGRRGLRNAQDRAKQVSCDLRDQLKKHAAQRCNPPGAIDEPAGVKDEEAADIGIGKARTKPHTVDSGMVLPAAAPSQG